MHKGGRNFYKNGDIRELPAYSLAEASRYLLIPRATLRSWVVGRYYPTESGPKFFKPVIDIPDKTHGQLSFMNLVEAHVLDAVRRDHQILLTKVRTAIGFLQKHFCSNHPLADQRFETDGLDLFVEKYGHLINVSQEGQLAIRKLLQAHLQRIEHDARGAAVRLYPFTRKRDPDEPRVVVIDPHVSFGRPVLAGTGIATAVIAQRYKAGESMDELAEDYGRRRSEIEEAIRCELWLEAA